MSELANQIQARKERLQRFAEAATQYQSRSQPLIDAAQATMLERCLAKPCRREYENKNRPSAYMPIARRILLAVASEFGMTVEEVLTPSNKPKYCLPRFVVVGLMIEMTNLSLPAIGRHLGGRDHTTVMNARLRAERLFAEEAIRNRVDQIKAAVLG